MRNIPGTKYVSKRKDGFYTLSITRKGKTKHLGCSKSLISILMMRDWCKANNWEPFCKPNKYIYHDAKWGSYKVQKKVFVDGKLIHKYYGSFKDLNQAREYRDLCISKNWDESLLICNNPLANNPLKYIHRTRSGKYAITKNNGWYGVYSNLIDAINERDLLIKYDWDYDLICEHDERLCGVTIVNGRIIGGIL